MHEEIQELLAKYLEGKCTEEENQKVKKHIKECETCKKILMEEMYDISYEYKDQEDESATVTYEAVDGEGSSSRPEKDNSDKLNASTDEEKTISDKKDNTVLKFVKSNLRSVIGIVVVAALLGGFYCGYNYIAALSVCKGFVTEYLDIFVIPKEGLYGGVIKSVYINEVQKKYPELEKYFEEDNNGEYKRRTEIIDTYLRLGAISKITSYLNDGEQDLVDKFGYIEPITKADEISKIKVNKADWDQMNVTVYVGPEKEGYSYNIVCKKYGTSWKILSVEDYFGNEVKEKKFEEHKLNNIFGLDMNRGI